LVRSASSALFDDADALPFACRAFWEAVDAGQRIGGETPGRCCVVDEHPVARRHLEHRTGKGPVVEPEYPFDDLFERPGYRDFAGPASEHVPSGVPVVGKIDNECLFEVLHPPSEYHASARAARFDDREMVLVGELLDRREILCGSAVLLLELVARKAFACL
jgi:hypothetical protein